MQIRNSHMGEGKHFSLLGQPQIEQIGWQLLR